MPIKFRCQHCKQLLGIAHTKAGSLVDCPTCGRTLRVPNLDGSIDPEPALGMDLADHDLRRALDELGQIGKSAAPAPPDDPMAKMTVEKPVTPAVREIISNREAIGSGTLRTDDEDRRIPSKSSSLAARSQHPDELQRVGHRQAVALEPLPALAPVEPPQNPRGVRQRPMSTAAVPDASPDQILLDLSLDVPLAARRSSRNKLEPSPGLRSVSLGVAIGISSFCLVLGLAIGFGIGRMWSSKSTAAEHRAAATSADRESTALDDDAPRFNGQLSYRNPQGKREPDAGARILAIPIDRPLDSKLPSVGFRPADDETSRAVAKKALLEMGGAEATADSHGRYVLDLSVPGTVHLIVLSRFQGRKPDAAWPKAAEKTLQALFVRPEQLIGGLAFHVETVEHNKTGPMVWDHIFERD
jgi:hypothetical protein